MPFQRRRFLQLLSAGLIGASVDVDRLLWVPGARTYLLPPELPTITTIEGWTAALLKEVGIEMRHVGMPRLELIDPGGQYRLEQQLQTNAYGHVKLDTQYNVSALCTLARAHVRPAAVQLVRHMRDAKIRVSAPLLVPTTGQAVVLTDPTSGVALRGWQACAIGVVPVASLPPGLHGVSGRSIAASRAPADGWFDMPNVRRFDILGG